MSESKYTKPIRQALILAAGKGSRLGEAKGRLPKAFINLGGKSLIRRSCELLLENGIERVLIGTGFMHDYFQRWAQNQLFEVGCIQNTDFARSGSLLTLLKCLESLDEEFLLLESDLLYEPPALGHLTRKSGSAILASGFTKSQDEVFIEMDEDSRLIKLSKNYEELTRLDAELVGISRLKKSDVHYLNQSLSVSQKEQMDYEIALSHHAESLQIEVVKVEDLIWCEIDTPEHLRRAKELILPAINDKNKRGKANQ